MPREVHEHFDSDGKRTGHTIVTRESEWDDETRARVLALAEHDAETCGCGCGLPISVAYKKQPFVVDTFTCFAGRALKQARRQADAKAKTEKRPDGWDDGLHYYVRPVEPEEERRAD